MSEVFQFRKDWEIAGIQKDLEKRKAGYDWLWHEVAGSPKYFLANLAKHLIKHRPVVLLEKKIFFRAIHDSVNLAEYSIVDLWRPFMDQVKLTESVFHKIYLCAMSYDYHSDTLKYQSLRLLMEFMRYEEHVALSVNPREGVEL